MTAYIIRRLLAGVLILLLVTVGVFLMMRLLPGDPLLAYLSKSDMQSMDQAQIDAIKHEFGMDKPLAIQYVDWMKGVVQGDLGKSMMLHQPISMLVAQRMPVTINLGILSFVIGTIVGIFFGVICAIRRGTWIDTLFTIMANVGITIPVFWVGILLIYLFALKLGWLPVSGYTSPFEDLGQNIRHLILPVFCLAIGPIAGLCRQTRSTMLEVVRQDYIRTAWSKGLRERTIVIRHTIKNALIPVVTILGMQVSQVFGGTVLIETVFNIPGMGRLMTNAIFEQDYQIVQAGVLIIGTIVVLSNLIVDISYGWFDPRITYE